LSEALQRNAKHEARLSNIQLLQDNTDAGSAAKPTEDCVTLTLKVVEVAGFFAALRMTFKRAAIYVVQSER
jgi:hypothetical protein